MRCCFQVCRAEPKYTTIAFLALLGCIEVGEIEIANFTGCTGMVIIAGVHNTKLEKRENVAAVPKINIKKSTYLHNRLSYFFRHLQPTVI